MSLIAVLPPLVNSGWAIILSTFTSIGVGAHKSPSQSGDLLRSHSPRRTRFTFQPEGIETMQWAAVTT
uniref:Putative secreted protein n=1 Tax=Anopheles darlingi TaxID=43151 RepID=A0A2M4DN84_ANODA